MRIRKNNRTDNFDLYYKVKARLYYSTFNRVLLDKNMNTAEGDEGRANVCGGGVLLIEKKI